MSINDMCDDCSERYMCNGDCWTMAMAKDKAAAAKAAEQHPEYTPLMAAVKQYGGRVPDVEESGVTFRPIGSNSSHMFYVGFRGPQLLVGVWDEYDGFIAREVESAQGMYLGHY